MKKLAIFIVLALLLTFCATPAYAQPALPHAFYGTVEINDSPAPVGTKVEAIGPGVITGKGNPIQTEVVGIYGTSNPYEQRLIVQGDIKEGADITFYVNDVSTELTAEWHSGEVTPLPLSVTIAAPPAPTVGGGARAAPPTMETTLFGEVADFRISDDGEILTTITATSGDGMLTITLPAGTIALDKYGNPLSSLTTDVDPSPPDPPEDANIIGLAYDFGPDGATFDPAITLEYTYDPADIPEGVVEEDLVLAYYHDGEWVECECTCDPETHCITACVCHFTCFAIITPPVPAPPPPPAPAVFSLSSLSVKPAEVEPEKAVTITVSVANTGGTEGGYTVVLKINGVKEVEKRVTVAAGGSETVTFSVTRKDAGSYSVVVDGLSASFAVVAPPAPPPPPPPAKPPVVPPVKPAINWPVLGGIIAGVVVVALLIFFLVRRRA